MRYQKIYPTKKAIETDGLETATNALDLPSKKTNFDYWQNQYYLQQYYYQDEYKNNQILDTSTVLSTWPSEVEMNWIPGLKFNLTDVFIWTVILTFWLFAVGGTVAWYYIWEATYSTEFPDQEF